MRANEFITEGLSHPIIVVDVQPEYSGVNDGDDNPLFSEIIEFVAKSTGPVLMYVNAESMGHTGDTIGSIKDYWNETLCPEEERYTYDEESDEYTENPNCPSINWARFQIVDKGYGYLRSWHDQGIGDREIIKTIRLMYQSKVNDSRMLFGGQNSETYEQGMKELLGANYLIGLDDPLITEWLSLSQLKKFNGAYLVGGGRDECLWEVKIMMDAFNIKYRMVDSLIYG